MAKDIVFIRNMVLAIVFVIFIGYNAHNTEVLRNLVDIVDVMLPKETEESDIQLANCLGEVSENINDLLPCQEDLINLNGSLMRIAGVRDYYNPEYGINVTTNDYVISHVDWTSTDYEISQMVKLKEYLDDRNIRLLYVNEPAKYIDDEYIQEPVWG